MNPDRYGVIYDSKYGNNDNIIGSSASTTAAAISPSHSYTKVHQNYYYNEYHEGILEIPDSFLKMLLNQLVTIAAVQYCSTSLMMA